ncbi:MAG: hypothetical protein E3J81_09620 [Dehalococcoidia bacterium]|nr:MAG: hypothetical protein E3J81_09620 [Dehalococcoidia bacterium]
MAEEQKQFMEISEDLKALMYQTWLPALMTTVLQKVKELPQEHKMAVVTGMCTTCEDLAMAGAVGIQPGMSWDGYLEYLKGTVPPIGPWTVKQDGDVFDLIYESSTGPDGRARCHCPLVQLGMSDPMPECCDSGARLAAKMIAAATNKPVEKTEVVDSPSRTGASVCHYRVRVKS